MLLCPLMVEQPQMLILSVATIRTDMGNRSNVGLMSIEEQGSCEWTLVKNDWKFQPDQ